MNKLLLATGNERKVGEARAACDGFGIEIEQVKLDIDEIQSRDPVVIAKHKAKEAYWQTNTPVVITDTAWRIPALNGFPGGYMKDVAEWFEPRDFIGLLSGYEDETICFTEIIVYTDGDNTEVFKQEYEGRIVDKPRGEGESIEQVAEFNGQTIAESRNQGEFSHQPEDYIWYQFAQWYTNTITK